MQETQRQTEGEVVKEAEAGVTCVKDKDGRESGMEEASQLGRRPRNTFSPRVFRKSQPS